MTEQTFMVVSDRDNYTSELHTNVDVDLKYHTSWDWLMPVVRKIYQLGLDNESTLLVRDAVAEANLDNTYSAVSEFIKKYTITQNQDDD